MSLIKDAGFEIQFSSYMNCLLFLPALLKRLIDRFIPKDESKYKPVDDVSPILNLIFDKIYKFEAYLMKMFRLPFGLSIVTVAKKP